LRKQQQIILFSFAFGVVCFLVTGVLGSIQNKDMKKDWVKLNSIVENINDPKYPSVQFLEELNKKHPGNSRLYYYSAYANMNQNQLDNSEYYFDETLKKRPAFLLNTHFLLSYARVTNANGNKEKAETLLKVAERNGIKPEIIETFNLAKEEIYGTEVSK
jgi:predicted Zn-dependent protease